MSALRIVGALMLAMLARGAAAQDATAWIECDAAAGQLVVTYHPGDGDAHHEGPFDHAVVFVSLLEIEESRVTATHDATIACRLGEDELSVLLSPTIGNVNLLGMCGGVVGGAVTITRNGATLVDALDLEPGFCAEADEYVSRIVVGRGPGDVVVQRTRNRDGGG